MRHIPTTWQQLYVDGRPRMWALCGAKSSPPGCGIPSITKESSGGWCETCITTLLEQINSVDVALLTPGIMFYYDAINAEAARCTTGEITRYPLWHKYSESFNNRLFIIWSVMMDRCYDPSNPDYQAWGAQGMQVAPEWWDFKQFVDDAPNGITGVFPLDGPVVGPNNSKYTY